MNAHPEHSDNQQENEKLRVENAQLKTSLEKEEFLHKTLYKQWNELNARMSAKEREFNRFKLGNVFYKYAFYLILFLAAPAYYFLSNSSRNNERIEPASQVTSSSAMTTNQILTANADTIPLPDVKLEKKEVIQPDTILSKPATANKPIIVKPIIDKPLADSVRNLIYSEGWDAYYEKSTSHYQKSSQKYEVWLAGWKDAEDDAKKLLTKSSTDTLTKLSGN